MLRTFGAPAPLVKRPTLRLRWVLSGLIAIALLAWITITNSRWYALRRLPQAQRAQLFQSVRQTVESSCASSEPALQAECRDQLDFLVTFPECDAACESLAARYRPLPGK
jgi:hypothetical protein